MVLLVAKSCVCTVSINSEVVADANFFVAMSEATRIRHIQ